MILPSPDKLNRFNKYALVMLAAKRARQLQEQGIARRALVKSRSGNPLTIAMEEIAGGRMVPTFEVQAVPELMEPEVPETRLTPEEFEEARAKVAISVESAPKASDNGQGEELPDEHSEQEEAPEEPELQEEELEISDEVDTILGLDDEDDAGQVMSEETDDEEPNSEEQ